MARYEVCWCGDAYPVTVAKCDTYAEAVEEFKTRNRHIFDRSYAQKHGLANTGTFDKIYHKTADGEWEEVSPYGEED